MHQYTKSGLNNVWLKNGYQFNHDSDNVLIDDKWSLHYSIACKIVCQVAKLSSVEFKYLRTEIKATQATLANALGVSESTIRNWERGRSEISPVADRLIRLIYRSCAVDDPKVIELMNTLVGCTNTQTKIILKFNKRWY